MCDLSSTRKSRRSGCKGTQEFFTPEDIASQMFNMLERTMFSDFSKTYCDTCAGNGNLVLIFLQRRLANCKRSQDILDALSSIYAVELMQDNVDEMKDRIKAACISKHQELCKEDPSKLLTFSDAINAIIDHNIVCSDFFDWNFEEWKPYPKVVNGILL